MAEENDVDESTGEEGSPTPAQVIESIRSFCVEEYGDDTNFPPGLKGIYYWHSDPAFAKDSTTPLYEFIEPIMYNDGDVSNEDRIELAKILTHADVFDEDEACVQGTRSANDLADLIIREFCEGISFCCDLLFFNKNQPAKKPDPADATA